MILVKYRMIIDNGYIETLDEQEAINYGNYIVIEEEIDETIDNDVNDILSN
jgi:hypothetical protein